MTNGEKIASLRKVKGMTQAELGEKLNVTFQAVSKWERGESYPDFETMQKIAKLFDVSLEYFSEEGVSQPKVEEEEKTEVLGVCKQCGRMIKKGEEKFATPYILCKSCDARNKAEETQKQNAEKKRREVHESMKRAARRRYRNWGLFWGILAAVAIIVIMAVSIKNVGAAIGTAIGAGIFTFTFVSQLYWGGAVRDVAECGGKIIGTPGVIFTFDLDGFIFLIGIKILFAVIRFLVWLITILFFGVIAFIISPVTFIPRFIKLLAGIEVDEIYDEKTGTII